MIGFLLTRSLSQRYSFTRAVAIFSNYILSTPLIKTHYTRSKSLECGLLQGCSNLLLLVSGVLTIVYCTALMNSPIAKGVSPSEALLCVVLG